MSECSTLQSNLQYVKFGKFDIKKKIVCKNVQMDSKYTEIRWWLSLSGITVHEF